MRKILAIVVLAGGIFLTSCGTGTQPDNREEVEAPDVRDTVLIRENDMDTIPETDTIPNDPAPTP